jgi:uncharacterized protein (DUF885 family)
LEKDVGVSTAMATQELERYTFRMPAQAPCYFYGFTRVVALREEIERALADRFDPRQFHDAILAQGLLPPDLMASSVRHSLIGR